MYLCYGRPDPWPDDENPPVPDLYTPMEDPIGYKAVNRKYMVIPDDNGSLVFRDRKWNVVPVEEALSQGARWVYVEAVLAYNELPVVTFRQVGLYTKLVTVDGLPPYQVALLPSQVEDPGILEMIDNRKPQPRAADQRELITIVLEF